MVIEANIEMKTEITRGDVMDMDAYAGVRKERRARITELKRDRRVHVGPDATFYFESYDTMWHQVHEMLYIERGGEEQIADELEAYNPLIPNGRELVTTLMFEVDDPDRREVFLADLGGVEETVTIAVGGETITGVPETDIDRTTADGKASAIQFIHFPFNDAQAEAFKTEGAQVVLGIGHAKYGHLAIMGENVRAALASDFA
jgi:hypothetical protein